MYNLGTRYKVSLVIPFFLSFLFIYRTVKIAYAQLPDIQYDQIALASILFLLEIVIVYVVSVAFFSLETIIRTYITDSQSEESEALRKELEAVPFSNKLEVLEKWDKKYSGRSIVRSVVFQTVLLCFIIYATTSSNSLVGIGISLSIFLQMLLDQTKLIRESNSLSVWFWQVKANITREVQVMYVTGAGIIYLLIVLLQIKL